jgi:gamma-glutamyl phosphate reductase
LGLSFVLLWLSSFSLTKFLVCGIDGVCHVFVDKAADINKAKCIVVDSKSDYPAACNAMVGKLHLETNQSF